MNENQKDMPISIVISDLKNKLVEIVNESKLPLSIIELVVKDLYNEINNAYKIQLANDKKQYNQLLELSKKEEQITTKE